ncbi:MAG: hypothetical protein GWP10_11475, partial [Nitrospiraceae bacterium]|nr:hypothetical protein [Nitrospiraceae bacterium]
SMNVEADKYSLNPGDTVNLKVTVEDQDGNPVKGALVSVNTEIVGYGSISPANATTDANGIAKFTYTAPSASLMAGKYINMHTIAKLMFTVSKEGYDLANTVTMQLITYNKNPSKWDIVRVEGNATIPAVTNWTVNQSSLKTTIHVHAYGVDGTPLANQNIAITYSNESYLSNPPTTKTTNDKGWANFTLTFKSPTSSLPTKVIRIGFGVNTTYTYTVGDSIDILYWNGDVGVPLYGGHISVNSFMDQGGYLTYTVDLYNQTNQHPKGEQQIGTVLTATPDGQLVDIKWPFFATTWEYVGINVYGDYSDSVIGTAGEWNGQADKTNATVNWLDWGVDLSDYGLPASWNKETTWDYLNFWYGIDMTPFTIKDGTGTFPVYGDVSTYRDLPVKLYVVTGGLTYYITDPSVNNFVMYGNQTLETEFAVQRAMSINIESFSMSKPYAWAGEDMAVSVGVYNETNALQPYTPVKIYNNKFASKSIYPAGIGYTTPVSSDEIVVPVNDEVYNNGWFGENAIPVPPVLFSWDSVIVSFTNKSTAYQATPSIPGAWIDFIDPSYDNYMFLYSPDFNAIIGAVNITSGNVTIYNVADQSTFVPVLQELTGRRSHPVQVDLGSYITIDYKYWDNSQQDVFFTDGISKEYNVTLSMTPVENGTVMFLWQLDGNWQFAVDDGHGHIVGIWGADASGTIDYTTGKVDIKFGQAPDMYVLVAMYNFDPAQLATVDLSLPALSSPTEADTFVQAYGTSSAYFGEYNVLEATQFPIVPQQLFISATPSTYVVDLGGTIGFSTQVTDANGKVLSGATVSATSTAGTIINAGNGEFILDTNGITAPSTLNEVQVTFAINGMDGYMVGATTVTVLVRNLPPAISVNSVSNGATIYANTLALSGYAYDDQGVTSVVVSVDGAQAIPANLVIVPGGVAWNTTLTGLSEGTHTITINATDSQGVYQTTTLNVNVKLLKGQPSVTNVINNLYSGQSTNMIIGIIGIILAIIALAIAGWALARKPKAAVPEEVPPEEEAPTEEEVPEETEEETSEEAGEQEEVPSEEEEKPPEEGGEEL